MASVSYGYWGAGRRHRIEMGNTVSLSLRTSVYNAPSISLQALDAFDQVRCLRWTKGNDRIVELYPNYHPDGSLGSVANTMHSPFSEAYARDGLRRLLGLSRGELDPLSGTIETPSLQLRQTVALDASGNWRSFEETDRQRNTSVKQKRSHSRDDLLRHIQTVSGGDWVSPVYDTAGNMTIAPRPDSPEKTLHCAYDAWNRLISIGWEGAYVVRWRYDGLGRRIHRAALTPAGFESRHYYYRADGAVLSESIEAAERRVIDRQYVFGAGGTRDLVARIRPQHSQELLYALPDALGNTVAIVDNQGDVKERFLYDALGQPLFLDGQFTPRTQQTSAFGWEHLSGGMYRDEPTGLYYDGAEFYHPRLGCGLTNGAVRNFGEVVLNSYVEEYPLYRAPLPADAGPGTLTRWFAERTDWQVYLAVGAAAIAVGVTLGATGQAMAIGGLGLAGAAAGGAYFGWQAHLEGAPLLTSVALGAGFGLLTPHATIAMAVGGTLAGFVGAGYDGLTGQPNHYGQLLGLRAGGLVATLGTGAMLGGARLLGVAAAGGALGGLGAWGLGYDPILGAEIGAGIALGLGRPLRPRSSSVRAPLYWHRDPATIAKIQAEGVLAQPVGAGGKYWATNRVLTKLGPGQWLIGGRVNLRLRPPFFSMKPPFTATYELTQREAALFRRAIGPRFSLNVAEWWKGLAGQYYYRAVAASWGERAAEAAWNIPWIGLMSYAGYQLAVYYANITAQNPGQFDAVERS